MKNRRQDIISLSALLLISICVMPSCSMNGDSHIVIAGSTSVQPYVEMLAEEYEIMYPEILVDIQGGGSSAGISAVGTGTADIGMSSRSLNQSEQEYWSVEIAKDGLALIVNNDNPVDNLSVEQICDIYTQKITNWSELGGSDAKIHIISREEGSGTRSAFQELVMSGEFISPKAIVQNSNGAVRQLVSDDPNAIGFISLGMVEQQSGLKPVKALMLDGVAPTQENAINGSYNLHRPFLLVLKEEPQDAFKHFIDFVLSSEGQRVLSDEGLICVSVVSDETDVSDETEA